MVENWDSPTFKGRFTYGIPIKSRKQFLGYNGEAHFKARVNQA
jgi:hypothetical protein